MATWATASASASTPPRRGRWPNGTPARAPSVRRTSRCSVIPGRSRSPPAPRCPGTASRRLLLWNFCRLHDLAPALRLTDEELAQLLGRAGTAVDAEVGEALLHLRVGQRLGKLAVHAVDRRARGLRRRRQRIPRGDVVAFYAGLLRSRHVRQLRLALARGDGERAQVAGLDAGDQRRDEIDA